MKSLLLTALAAAVALSAAGAVAPQQRVSANSHLKQINVKGHAQRAEREAAQAPMKAAPANAVEVPFTHTLGKNGTEVKNYTVINANNDNRKWQHTSVTGYAACMAPNADAVDKNDDWLITVPVHLTAGDYVVSCKVGFMGSSATGVEMDVKMGESPTVEGMTTVVSPSTVYTTKDLTLTEFNCSVATEGYYYIGFHCTTSKAMKGALKLADVGMRAGTVTPPVTVDPPAAGTLTWELAPKGALKATVRYTAPTLTQGGKELTEISKVVLTSRWGVDTFTYETVTPGQVIVQDVEMYEGSNNRFTAVAYVGDVAGVKVEHKYIYCGPDTPLPPSNVTLTPSADYRSATLSWSAPDSVGENGGYVDTSALTYYIFDAFGSYYDPAVAQTTDTSYTFSYADLEGQDFVAYQVTAGYGERYSLDSSSDIVVVGKPAALPFAESFTGGVYDQVWVLDQATTDSYSQAYGTITDDDFASMVSDSTAAIASQDGDNGFFYWLPYEKDAMMGLASVRADISKAAQPVLDFWYQGQGSKIEALVAGGLDSLRVVKTLDLQQNPTTGWTLCRIPLTDYKAAGAVSMELRLTAVHNTDSTTWSVPVDAIRIHDLVDVNLAVAQATMPATVEPMQAVNVAARIINYGQTEVTGATVTLEMGGKTIATQALPALAANAHTTVSLPYTVALNAPDTVQLTVRVDAAGDALAADNTAAVSAQVKRKDYATVTDLTASLADGGAVLLQWTEPVNDTTTPRNISEDFESSDYTPMSITGAGDWTVHDGDGAQTYNIFRETYNPYQTQPIGFQLFNRVVAQVPDVYWADAEPHSGNTFMLAPSSQVQNDNWLISPRLSGREQTVSFWAKSYTVTWPETFKVYYSTAGNSVQELTHAAQVTGAFATDSTVGETWTEFKVALPAGATHFAICHNSYNTLALFVDDVTFEAAPQFPADLKIEGYMVLRDGTQLTAEPVAATTYTDTPLASSDPTGSYTFSYTVVPVYNYGVAAESNVATVDITHSGVTTVQAADATGKTRVYTLSGIEVDAANVVPGIYIVVRPDGTASKAVVR